MRVVFETGDDQYLHTVSSFEGEFMERGLGLSWTRSTSHFPRNRKKTMTDTTAYEVSAYNVLLLSASKYYVANSREAI